MNARFHELTVDERALVAKIVRQRNLPGVPGDVYVAYHFQGDFTTAAVVHVPSGRLWLGVAKQLPTQKRNRLGQIKIALARAIAARPILLQQEEVMPNEQLLHSLW